MTQPTTTEPDLVGETVIFFRDGMFYPIQFSGKKPTREEAADHARLNPGTLRIERLNGEVLWPTH